MAPYLMTTSRHTVATEVVGVILAGGRSSRMGRDKAGLCINNESLLLRARRSLLAAGCERVLLSGPPRQDWPDACVPDQLTGAGPVGGIISALAWAVADGMPTKNLLFVPVDAPLLSPELLASMLQKTDSGVNGCRTPGSPLPVVLKTTEAVLKQCAAAQVDLEAKRSWSVKRFVEPLHLVALDETDAIAPQLINVNTPAQWEGLLHELETRS